MSDAHERENPIPYFPAGYKPSGMVCTMESVDIEIQRLWSAVSNLRWRAGQLEKALKTCVSFLEDREDIDDNGNANEAMQLLIELKERGLITD